MALLHRPLEGGAQRPMGGPISLRLLGWGCGGVTGGGIGVGARHRRWLCGRRVGRAGVLFIQRGAGQAGCRARWVWVCVPSQAEPLMGLQARTASAALDGRGPHAAGWPPALTAARAGNVAARICIHHPSCMGLSSPVRAGLASALFLWHRWWSSMRLANNMPRQVVAAIAPGRSRIMRHWRCTASTSSVFVLPARVPSRLNNYAAWRL